MSKDVSEFNSQEIYDRRREVLDRIYEHCPNMRSLVYPKSYLLPLGYAHPEIFALSAFSSALHVLRRPDPTEDKTQCSVHVTTCMLVRYQMPTWFVGRELCEALLRTEPPQDLLLEEIPMPMPSMLFMLPSSFSETYFGYNVPFLTLSIVDKNAVLESKLVLYEKKIRTLEVHNEHPFMVGTMLSWESGAPLHYDFRSPLNRPVKDLMTAPFEVTSTRYLTESEINQDMATDHKMINLAINLLLAMTAEPELVSPEQMIRPADKKNGVIRKRALWTPRFLGKNFRIQYDKVFPSGTHQSPVAHWRIGHWRNQRHGPKNTLVKRLWIRPVFVGLTQEKGK